MVPIPACRETLPVVDPSVRHTDESGQARGSGAPGVHGGPRTLHKRYGGADRPALHRLYIDGGAKQIDQTLYNGLVVRLTQAAKGPDNAGIRGA